MTRVHLIAASPTPPMTHPLVNEVICLRYKRLGTLGGFGGSVAAMDDHRLVRQCLYLYVRALCLCFSRRVQMY